MTGWDFTFALLGLWISYNLGFSIGPESARAQIVKAWQLQLLSSDQKVEPPK